MKAPNLNFVYIRKRGMCRYERVTNTIKDN